jgi:hypothetical protein
VSGAQTLAKLNENFLRDVSSASSSDDLDRIVREYSMRRAELQSRHLADRKQTADRLRQVVEKQELKNVDSTWKQAR